MFFFFHYNFESRTCENKLRKWRVAPAKVKMELLCRNQSVSPAKCTWRRNVCSAQAHRTHRIVFCARWVAQWWAICIQKRCRYVRTWYSRTFTQISIVCTVVLQTNRNGNKKNGKYIFFFVCERVCKQHELLSVCLFLLFTGIARVHALSVKRVSNESSRYYYYCFFFSILRSWMMSKKAWNICFKQKIR